MESRTEHHGTCLCGAVRVKAKAKCRKMKVRKASGKDIEQVCELVNELGYESTKSSLSAQLDTYIESDSSLLLVAENARGALSGMIAGHLIPLIHQTGSVGRITSFVVRTSDRSSGVGATLLEAMEVWFSERECLRFEVTSGDHRARAHEFYKSKGYVPDERRYLKRRDA